MDSVVQPPWASQALAPNGKRVTDNFAAWFRKSVIVSSDGSPMVVTHGTTADFDAFRPAQRAGAHGHGIYMACPELGQPEAVESEYGDRTLHLVVRMETPFYWRRSEESYDALVDGELLEAVLGHELAGQVVQRMDDVGIDDGFGTELVDELRRRGHDGLVLVPPWSTAALRGGDVLVAWDPRQLKLAYGNSGLFSDSASLSDGEAGPARLTEVLPVQPMRPASGPSRMRMRC